MLWIEAKEILLVYKTTKVQTTYWGELCEVGKTILGTTTTKGILIIICPSFVFCQWETWIVEIWNGTLVVSHSHTAKEQKQFQLIALASILCKLGDCNPFPPNFWLLPSFTPCRFFYCWERKIFSATLWGSSGWFKNLTDMRQINRRKSNLNMYKRGPLRKMRLKDKSAIEAYMASERRRKG